MTDNARPPPSKPALTPRAEAELAARRAREAEALRENLRRRKAQTRRKPASKPGESPQ